VLTSPSPIRAASSTDFEPNADTMTGGGADGVVYKRAFSTV
jgi:hypothetical protein